MSEQSVLHDCVEARLFVYRIMLSSLEDEAKGNLLVQSGTIISYPFICSPNVSIAIYEYLLTSTALSDEVLNAKQKLTKENSFWAGFFKNFIYDLEQRPKVHSVKSEKLEAVAQAMCAELNVDMEKLRGKGDSVSSDQAVRQ